MRILSPVAGPEEVEPLVSGGADELYCGLFPQEWYERWGRGSWPNRRGPGPANVETTEELLRLADAAHDPALGGRTVPLFVALNQQYYPDDQAELLLELARRITAEGAADAFVVTDPGFLALLHREVPGCTVFSSSVTVALNAGSVRFLSELGAARVILSRHLDLHELAELRRAAPEIDVEVFLLNDNCWFEEGFCSTTHTMPGFGVYCMTPWELHVRREAAAGTHAPPRPIDDPEERARWDFLVEEHRELLRHLGTRGTGGGKAAIPLGPCGLCALPELMELGIGSGKIVGREASLYRKLRSVQSVRYIRDLYAETGDARATKRAAVELRADPDGCSAGYSCYYRGARERDLVPLPSRPRGPRRPPRSSR
jgi:U32 family peptidase